MVTTRAKSNKTLNTLKTMVCSNDDLLTEILRRLPAKSILGFKSVSKHWKSLLSNRHFTLLFDKLSISPGCFYANLYIPFDVENQSSKPDMSDIRGVRILQSCNGLFLCCTGRPSEHKYYVFNPTTKQVAVIPPVIGGQVVRKNIRFMGLAFHQTDCVHYKIVSVYRANSVPKPGKELYHIQIYSSDSGKWRISCESFHMSVIDTLFCRYGVYWNGAIHWDIFNNPFYFKLDVEQFQNLPLPVCYEPKVSTPFRTCRYVGESRGHLLLVETAQFKDPLHLNVYEMLSDHSGWFLKYQVGLHELLEACPEMIFGYSVMSIPCYDLDIIDVVRGENEEDTFMMVRICRKIIRYNILDKSFKLIFNLSGSVILEKAHRYIETVGSF